MSIIFSFVLGRHPKAWALIASSIQGFWLWFFWLVLLVYFGAFCCFLGLGVGCLFVSLFLFLQKNPQTLKKYLVGIHMSHVIKNDKPSSKWHALPDNFEVEEEKTQNFMKSHLYFLKLALSGTLLTVYCCPGLTALGLQVQMSKCYSWNLLENRTYRSVIIKFS